MFVELLFMLVWAGVLFGLVIRNDAMRQVACRWVQTFFACDRIKSRPRIRVHVSVSVMRAWAFERRTYLSTKRCALDVCARFPHVKAPLTRTTWFEIEVLYSYDKHVRLERIQVEPRGQIVVHGAIVKYISVHQDNCIDKSSSLANFF